MRCRVLVAVVLAGILVGVSSPPAPVSAQGPSLTCDVPFPSGGRTGAASNHDCWLSESGGQGAVPWPPAASFAEGSVVTVYSLRWSGDGAVRLYCSAESGRGPDYDRWFVAAAVRGGSAMTRASYGVRAASVPGGDRVVSSFVGGRDARVDWDRGSRYDAAARRWVSRSWAIDRSRVAPTTPAFMRPAQEAAAPRGDAREADRRPSSRSGYTCPEFGLLPRQLGDRVDESVGGPGAPFRCLDVQGGVGEIFRGDEFNVQAQYLPGRGSFGGEGDRGDGDDDDDDGDGDGNGGGEGDGDGEGDGGGTENEGETQGGSGEQGSDPNGEGGNGIPDDPGCGGENNAVCDDLPGGNNQDPGGQDPNGNQNTQTPQQGRGHVVETAPRSPDEVLGSGRRLADAPVVAAFSSGMACVERESVVLRRYRRQRWIDDSYAEHDPACDLSAAVLLPGQSAAGLRPAYCDSEGFGLAGNRVVQSGSWEAWWEYAWEANPARTDAHFPWARVFWQDGGGRSGFESGGVIVGDDGTAACLVEQGFVCNPALPGVVPPVAAHLAGRWADYTSGAVSVRCPKEDGSAGFTAAPAGAQSPAFDVLVSLDFAPLVHEEALAESYTLAQYESARSCSDWPADADPAPVPGVDCGVRLPVSPARQQRLDSFSREVRTSAGTGRITSFFVDDALAMMAHSWDVRRASRLSGRFELDTPWNGGADVGSGVAAEARRFGPPVSSWGDCGRRDFLIGRGADSLWGAWVAQARSHAAEEVAGSLGFLGLAEGFDGRTAVSCSAGGDCRPEPGAFLARHLVIEREARRLHADRGANPSRVCGIGDRVSPPGP